MGKRKGGNGSPDGVGFMSPKPSEDEFVPFFFNWWIWCSWIFWSLRNNALSKTNTHKKTLTKNSQQFMNRCFFPLVGKAKNCHQERRLFGLCWHGGGKQASTEQSVSKNSLQVWICFGFFHCCFKKKEKKDKKEKKRGKKKN